MGHTQVYGAMHVWFVSQSLQIAVGGRYGCIKFIHVASNNTQPATYGNSLNCTICMLNCMIDSCTIGTLRSNGSGNSILSDSESHALNGIWYWGISRHISKLHCIKKLSANFRTWGISTTSRSCGKQYTTALYRPNRIVADWDESSRHCTSKARTQ